MIEHLDLYLNTPSLGVIQAADVALVEENARLTQVGFRYHPDYLAHPDAFSIDPAQLPLSPQEIVFECRAGTPAFIDDYLPDAWGRRVLAKLTLYRQGRRLNANSTIDILSRLGQSRIGAICLAEHRAPPHYDPGSPVSALQAAEQAAQQIDHVDFQNVDIEEISLLYLANSGTGVGGARPKALLHDNSGHYLAKFNRITQDSYNNARVELACLLMARDAGLEVGNGQVITGINGREVLLLDRFDTAGTARHHLITANGLLKEPTTQSDPGHAFRYDDVCNLLRRYSSCIEQDLTQLLGLMLFNRAINNTDDHERNFSLIHRGDGYRLAPAYDLVPSTTTGGYHAAGYQYQPCPPRPTETARMGRIFGLPKPVVARISEQVIEAIRNWPHHARRAGVSEEDSRLIQRCLQP